MNFLFVHENVYVKWYDDMEKNKFNSIQFKFRQCNQIDSIYIDNAIVKYVNSARNLYVYHDLDRQPK